MKFLIGVRVLIYILKYSKTQLRLYLCDNGHHVGRCGPGTKMSAACCWKVWKM